VQTPQCKKSAHENIKRQPSKLSYSSKIEEFTLTALGCPFGTKLKIRIENWAEERSVISVVALTPSKVS
jgi:hypothetical protein